MSFRRDHLTANVEMLDDIEEILERQVEPCKLEDLKYYDGNPSRQRETIKKWVSEQEIWIDKFPQLMEEVQEGLRIPSDQLKQYLQVVNEALQTDVRHALLYAEENSENPEQQKSLKEQILDAVRKVQQKRASLAKNSVHLESEMTGLLEHKTLSQLLEREGVTIEAGEQG